jgi:hypothetical protein
MRFISTAVDNPAFGGTSSYGMNNYLKLLHVSVVQIIKEQEVFYPGKSSRRTHLNKNRRRKYAAK